MYLNSLLPSHCMFSSAISSTYYKHTYTKFLTHTHTHTPAHDRSHKQALFPIWPFLRRKKKSSIQWTAAETEGWRVCIRFNVISAQMNQLYEKYTVCYTSRVLSTLYLIGCQKKLKKKKRRKTNKNTEHVAVHYCRFSVFSKNVFLKK